MTRCTWSDETYHAMKERCGHFVARQAPQQLARLARDYESWWAWERAVQVAEQRQGRKGWRITKRLDSHGWFWWVVEDGEGTQVAPSTRPDGRWACYPQAVAALFGYQDTAPDRGLS